MTISIDELCANLERTAAEVRLTFRSQASAANLLQSVWLLQDQLHQLLAVVRDHPSESDGILRLYPDLITRMVDVLRTVSFAGSGKLPAVRAACDHINDDLIALQQAKEIQKAFRAAASG